MKDAHGHGSNKHGAFGPPPTLKALSDRVHSLAPGQTHIMGSGVTITRNPDQWENNKILHIHVPGAGNVYSGDGHPSSRSFAVHTARMALAHDHALRQGMTRTEANVHALGVSNKQLTKVLSRRNPPSGREWHR